MIKLVENKVALILPDGKKKNDGPFRCGNLYKLLGEGLDFYILRLRGKRVYIDKEACELMDRQNFESTTLFGMKQEMRSWRDSGEFETDDYEG
tara:strand:- start:161 stop:439 length:279 start_codon:yes stop_codon:yes gene_type:complete